LVWIIARLRLIDSTFHLRQLRSDQPVPTPRCYERTFDTVKEKIKIELEMPCWWPSATRPLAASG
jgi:hypothetical protein